MSNKKPKDTSNHYVNNAQLKLELERCYQDNKLSDKLANMLILIVDRTQRKLTYVSDLDRQDVRSHAVERILSKWNKADLSRPNLFSYYTQIIKNDLYDGWNKLQVGKAHISYDVLTEKDF